MPLSSLKYSQSSIFPIKNISIRPGVNIMLSFGRLESRLKHRTGVSSPIFELTYSRRSCVKGEVNNRLVELKPAYSSLGFIKQASGYSEYHQDEEVHMYSIWVEPDTFNTFCQAVNGRDDLGFHSFQKGPYNTCSFKTDIREEAILNKLDTLFIRPADSLNRLLLESQVLELLSLNLERVLDINSAVSRLGELSKTDIERLMLARDIILNRLESPPSLLELSQLIQMNDCKLKRSFKLHFGKTVYEFIREQRLEKSFALLIDQHLNVSQSAFAVGYTNVSHFSKAFQKKYGVSPGKLTTR